LWLSVTDLADAADISVISGLREVDFSHTPVSDLGPLKGLPSLQTLICSDTPVSDLAPLKGLPNLQTLYCSSTPLSDLTPLKGSSSLQELHCSSTSVSDLAPLKGLRNLQTLICSSTPVSDLTPLKGVPKLQTLHCSSTPVSDLAPLMDLPNLQTLNCSFTSVGDLTPLKGLPSLQTLDCSYTSVGDLTPLEGLPNLQTLTCSSTPVGDLAPLKGLRNLQTLICSSTPVGDLTSLKGLSSLKTLACPSTPVRDLAPLECLRKLQGLYCSFTPVSDLIPLKGLLNLETLDCSSTPVSDLAPLEGLPNLRTLYCSSTPVSDLGPLKGLRNLQSLICLSTPVSDLGPLKGLPNLQGLYCSYTPVSDLAPLKGVPNLQELYCSSTPVSDLVPLKGLRNLQSLICSSTSVRDITPLKGLPSLQELNCSSTSVSDLAPLKGLLSLQTLICSDTPVSDLTPLKGVPNLQTLYCSSTLVSDLIPLKGLLNLETLDCSSTPVSDLAPLMDLPNLQDLNCSRCQLNSVPVHFWMKLSLTNVILYETHLPNVPAEVLSQQEDADCLESLLAHLRDLESGQEKMPDIKLMVLGNGRVGKTQMCRRLRGEDYDDKVESTHGIVVRSAPLPQSQGSDVLRLQIWDFGGQDIYHGTHTLFMRSRAIFAVVWIPEAEKTSEHRHGDFVFRNQPLGYWLEYIRHFGGADSPAMIIQTRCDVAEDELARPPVSNEALGAFRPAPKILHYSAQNNRGRASLDDAVAQSVEWLRNKKGIAVIGTGRAKVKREIEKMRDTDATKPLLEREHRTISHDRFLQLCREAGGISEPKQLLNYLHNAGTVFYREGLFEDRIIIDQGWALESIYAVFHREKCYPKLLRQNGRFTRTDLAEWIWDEAGHGIREQELFLSMMQSCGICFQYRPATSDGLIEAEYIAPDLLPPKPEGEIAQKWDADRPIERAEFDYPLLTPALMREILSRIGRRAGIDADYWRDGVYVYEATTGSRGLIEQKLTGLWTGQITIQTQRGQAAVLLGRLVKLVEEEQNRIGMTSSGRPATPTLAAADAEIAHALEKPETSPALKFTQEPAPQSEYFVSYAWGDSTPEGRTRENVVDHLCDAAKQRGISILRDKKIFGLGERISKFMQRLGRGDRVFVVLSDKYLKSPYCMYELFEVWRNCRQDDEEFLSRIRVYALPDAKIWSPLERAQLVVYWKVESQKLEVLVNEHGFDILGHKDYQHYKLMKDFSRHIGDILTTVTDILQPRTFEDFEKYGFN
jgi:internalin A